MAAAIAGVLALPTVAAAQTPSVQDLVRVSQLIFLGTVKAVGESTPTVPRAPNTVVVTVDDVVDVQPPLGNERGHTVTVCLHGQEGLKPGDRALFFTAYYSAGPSLGLDAAGTRPAEPLDRAQAEVSAARQALADQALSGRLRSASAVVVGVVAKLEPLRVDPDRWSEHDPTWRRAEIRVQSVVAGSPPKAPVVVTFAASDDVVWARAPKLAEGQTGVFLLQPPAAASTPRFKAPEGLFVTDPLDVEPVGELARIRRLAKTLR